MLHVSMPKQTTHSYYKQDPPLAPAGPSVTFTLKISLPAPSATAAMISCWVLETYLGTLNLANGTVLECQSTNRGASA